MPSKVRAEAFLQAWRRWDDVPEQPLPWLIGTARKVIGNQRRGNRRGEALVERLAVTTAPWSEDAHERREALQALAGLPAADREALLLASWDGLTPAQAAAVLGVREGTFRVRLHRARPRWVVPAVAAAAFAALGGAAYAGGLVPQVVVDRLGDGPKEEPLHRIGEVEEVFDLVARDGDRVQLFLGRNDAGGECWMVTHDLGPDDQPEDFGYGCVAAGVTDAPAIERDTAVTIEFRDGQGRVLATEEELVEPSPLGQR